MINKDYDLTEYEISTLVVGSFRYHLGRMTYAVSEFVSVLQKMWPDLDQNTKNCIQRDLEAAFEKERLLNDMYKNSPEKLNSPLGMEMDREEWLKIRRLYTKEK